MSEYYKSIYSGAQIDASLGRIINGELDDAVEGANEAADRAESAADAIQSAIDNLPEGAVPVIDDLTTGGRTVALSAEQGKELKGELDTAQSLAANALDAVEEHAGRTDNPHEVTAPQIGAIPATEKGAPNGVAPLDGDGKLPVGNLLLSNDNHLDNAWFASPYLENQRGQGFYSVPYAYSIDRWATSLGLTVSPDGVTLPPTGGMWQLFESPATYYGRQVTLSAAVAGSAYSGAVVVPETNDTVAFAVSNGIIELYIYREASGTVLFRINNISGTDLLINRAKLELGSVSTLHLDGPPSPAEQELNRQVCRRYAKQIDQYSRYRMVSYDPGFIDFLIPLPTTMRILPSISGAVFSVQSLNGLTTETGFTFTPQFLQGSALLLRALKPSHGLTDARLFVTTGGMLSADL